MKPRTVGLFLLLAWLSVVMPPLTASQAPVAGLSSASKDLPVEKVRQEQSQWCWAACAEAVIQYYGQSVTQCQIANYNWGLSSCCGSPSSLACNQPTNLNPNVRNILSHWNVGSTSSWSSVSWPDIVSEIDANRPVWVRWGWDEGGGHFVLIRGYSSNAGLTVSYMNPGQGAYYVADYDWMVSGGGHTWTHSLTDIAPLATPTATRTSPASAYRVYLPIVRRAWPADSVATPTATAPGWPTRTRAPTPTSTRRPSTPLEIAVCTDRGEQLHPAVAFDPRSGAYVVAWPDMGAGDLEAGVVYPGSASLAGRFTVSSAREIQRQPAIAANTSSGGYLIAWQDRRNGPAWDIYAYVQP